MRLMLPFGSYTHRAPQVASRRLVNCYAEQVPVTGKAPVALLRAPGIEPWVELPTSPVRGMCVHQNVLHVVSGEKLYSVSSGGTIAELGDLPGTGRVSMASNGTQLVIVAPPDGYTYDATRG